MTKREKQAATDHAQRLTDATAAAYATADAVVRAYGIDSPEADIARDAAWALKTERDAAWDKEAEYDAR